MTRYQVYTCAARDLSNTLRVCDWRQITWVLLLFISGAFCLWHLCQPSNFHYCADRVNKKISIIFHTYTATSMYRTVICLWARLQPVPPVSTQLYKYILICVFLPGGSPYMEIPGRMKSRSVPTPFRMAPEFATWNNMPRDLMIKRIYFHELMNTHLQRIHENVEWNVTNITNHLLAPDRWFSIWFILLYFIRFSLHRCYL